MNSDLSTSSLGAAAAALARRKVSAVDLTEHVLARVAELNPRLHALTETIAVTARKEARRVDRRRSAGTPLGRLAGVPVVIKDIIDTVPAACSAGLPFLSAYRPSRDAVVVRRLRRAGAVIVGVSATDPGAFGVRTPAVTHPQAPALTVGGSSGGSAAALAAGLCFAALGTDTGGSIRIPAACCAVAGFKPTRGRVSTAGVRPLVWSLDHVGPLTRYVGDLAAVQQVLDPLYARTTRKRAGRRPIVGYDPGYARDADGTVRRATQQALAACKELGAQLREIALPHPDDALEIHTVIFCAEAAAYHFAEFPDCFDEYPPSARQLLDMAHGHKGYQYVQAMRRRTEITRGVEAVFDEVDFIIVPTLPVATPRRDARTIRVAGRETDFTLALVRYTCLFDHTGHPVVAMPVDVSGPGVVTSAQVVGPLDRDAGVIAFAERLEKALGLQMDFAVAA